MIDSLEQRTYLSQNLLNWLDSMYSEQLHGIIDVRLSKTRIAKIKQILKLAA